MQHLCGECPQQIVSWHFESSQPLRVTSGLVSPINTPVCKLLKMAGLLHLSQFLQYACTCTHKSTDHCNYQHSICVAPHIFGANYRTKCPGDQILIGRGVPMMQKQCDTRLQKTKPMVVNKTRKVEIHVADNQPRNSCMKAASDHEFTFGSAIEPTKKKHNAL